MNFILFKEAVKTQFNFRAKVKAASDDWFIAVYEDGSWRNWQQRHCLPNKGWGYECREVLTYNESTGEPIKAVLRPPPPEWLGKGKSLL